MAKAGARVRTGWAALAAGVAASAVIAVGVAPASAQVTPRPVDFDGPETFPTLGGFSRAVTSADFDVDGDLDVATANEDTDDVSVLLNDGTGGFTADGTYPVGNGPWELASDDFDNDGYPDLVVVNGLGNTVSILLNAGDATFGPGLTLPTGATPVGVVTTDFEGNGNADFAITNQDDDTVQIFLGDGTGDFIAYGTIGVGDEPALLAVGDFVRDGRPDLAVANSGSNTVSVLINEPLDFVVRTVEGVGAAPNSLAVADFDTDGFDDIAVHVNSAANFGPDYVTILLNNGFGFFEPAVSYPAVGVRLAAATTAADFNADGFADVAITGLDTDTVGILLGDGEGRLTGAQIFDAAGAAESIVAGDFSGGSAPDLALAYLGTQDVVALLTNVTVLPSLFEPVLPFRIADTRDGTGGVGSLPLEAGDVLEIDPRGVAGVPTTGVGAVALNVTAADPDDDGYLTVYPCSDDAPNASNVNYRAGQIAEPNAVIVGLASDTGTFCITTFATTDVIVDITGWFQADAGFAAATPVRIADTRDGTGVAEEPLAPGEVLTVAVTDDLSLGAAALNVTAANTTAAGYLTVYPCTPTVPYASSVNYEAGQDGTPNAVISALDEDGQVCITTSATVDVIVDLAGAFTRGAGFTGLVPERVGDTRDGTGGVAIGKIGLGEILRVAVTDDPEARGVALNVTATEADGNGYLTVFACAGASPYASNVNYTTEDLSSANAVLIGVNDDGEVCVSASAAVHVVVDITGTFD